MDINFVNLKINNVVAYTNENGKRHTGEAFEDFIPFIEEFTINDPTSFQLRNVNDISQSLEGYDRTKTNKRLTEEVIRRKKIDVTLNDINPTPSMLIFNLTDSVVTCFNNLNIPFILSPLKSEKLKEMWHGKIVIIQVHRLMTPYAANNLLGLSHEEQSNKISYLVDILNKSRYVPTESGSKPANRENYGLGVMSFAQDLWDKISYMDNDFRESTIKVVTSSVLSAENFKTTDSDVTGKDVSIYVPNLQLYFVKGANIAGAKTPALNYDGEQNIFKKFIIPGTKFIYIVDRANKIGDRFYNIGGSIEKVIRCNRFEHHDEGLFQGHFDDNFNLIKIKKADLDKIDDVPYLYTSQEEAHIGADKAKQYEDELRLRRTESEAALLDLKNETNITINRIRKEQEEDKARHARELQESEQRFIQFKRDLESSSLREKNEYEKYGNGMKNYFDERKYVRDDIRYERDSSLETLKTVASVCGVLATGFLVLKQLGKAQ